MPQPKDGSAITRNKPDAQACMAKGCDRRALYRSGKSVRGYCAAHRILAVHRCEVIGENNRQFHDVRERMRAANLAEEQRVRNNE